LLNIALTKVSTFIGKTVSFVMWKSKVTAFTFFFIVNS
jgi:hypothetical protein